MRRTSRCRISNSPPERGNRPFRAKSGGLLQNFTKNQRLGYAAISRNSILLTQNLALPASRTGYAQPDVIVRQKLLLGVKLCYELRQISAKRFTSHAYLRQFGRLRPRHLLQRVALDLAARDRQVPGSAQSATARRAPAVRAGLWLRRRLLRRAARCPCLTA